MEKWRRCVCGTKIAWGHTLCAECLKAYGARRNEWPEWLRFWVDDTQRELNAERNHREQTLNEDARVQFRNVVREQVKIGLVNRREALRGDCPPS